MFTFFSFFKTYNVPFWEVGTWECAVSVNYFSIEICTSTSHTAVGKRYKLVLPHWYIIFKEILICKVYCSVDCCGYESRFGRFRKIKTKYKFYNPDVHQIDPDCSRGLTCLASQSRLSPLCFLAPEIDTYEYILVIFINTFCFNTKMYMQNF